MHLFCAQTYMLFKLTARTPQAEHMLASTCHARDLSFAAQVAHCAQSVEGKEPLIIPSYYPADCWPGTTTSALTFFDLDLYKDSWFIDAGTSDVTKMGLNKRGLAMKGGLNPPLVRHWFGLQLRCTGMHLLLHFP